MKRLVPVFLLALVPAPLPAQTDAELNQPIELRVVLKCGSHNWLGKQFRDDLRNNLAGMLQDALGPMAAVSVYDLKETPADQWQPGWKQFDAKGFAGLDGPQDLDGAKTHYLRVDFVNGQYELQARQVDGSTGWVSPWRRERTADRVFVPRLAGKMIGQDFGIVGTVVGKSDTVRIRFQGGRLGATLDRWVHRDDVFALYQVMPKNGQGKIRAAHVPDTVIRMTEDSRDGAAVGQVVYRGRTNPVAGASAIGGFRCVKMSTVIGPMRLRLIDDKGQPHVRALQVRVHPQAFQEGFSSEEEVLNPDRGGVFISKTKYNQVAYVRVVTGGSTEIARMPVPVFDDREVTVTVGLNPDLERAGQLYGERTELVRRYRESWLLQRDRYTEIAKQSNNSKSLARAEALRKALDDDLERLHARREQIKKEAGSQEISFAECDQIDGLLKDHRERLNRLIGQLKEFIALDNAPDKVERRVKLKELHNKAKVLEDGFDFDGALAVYRQIVKEFPEETNVKREMELLERNWALKSDAHRQAREFIFKEWPQVKTADEVATKLPTARQKMQVCVGVNDKLTLLKLRATLPDVGKILADEITALKNAGEADTDKVNKLKKLVDDFTKFGQEVDAALKGKP